MAELKKEDRSHLSESETRLEMQTVLKNDLHDIIEEMFRDIVGITKGTPNSMIGSTDGPIQQRISLAVNNIEARTNGYNNSVEEMKERKAKEL